VGGRRGGPAAGQRDGPGGRHRPARRRRRLDRPAAPTGRRRQRQQLKWLASAAVLLAGYNLLAFLYTRGTIRSVPPLIDTAVSGLGLVVVPAAIGMAVLRYRLYDIDRLINRTLVHGLLTLLLGAGYAAVALVLGQLAGRDSSLAVAGATLAVAALFQPARLRDEVDLDTLTGELLAVAAQTMQPTKASLWLRDAGRR